MHTIFLTFIISSFDWHHLSDIYYKLHRLTAWNHTVYLAAVVTLLSRLASLCHGYSQAECKQRKKEKGLSLHSAPHPRASVSHYQSESSSCAWNMWIKVLVLSLTGFVILAFSLLPYKNRCWAVVHKLGCVSESVRCPGTTAGIKNQNDQMWKPGIYIFTKAPQVQVLVMHPCNLWLTFMDFWWGDFWGPVQMQSSMTLHWRNK